MIYWIENTKDGAFVAGAETYEEALAIQDQKLKEGIDTYIREEGKVEEKSPQEIIQEVMSSGKLSEESLKHIDSIVENLARLRKVDETGGTSWMWLVMLWFLFGYNITKITAQEPEDNEEAKEETNETD